MYYYITDKDDDADEELEKHYHHQCIKLSVALFLRLMEYSKEMKPTDDKIHEIADEILELLEGKKPHKYLKMKHFTELLN